MKRSRSLAKLAKFLHYVLGRRPDEFGLFPDENGYVKTKDLMKAMAEEQGWRHVRPNLVREVAHSVQPSVVESKNQLIRAVDRSSLPTLTIPLALPKLLYLSIRRRAHPVVHEKGIIRAEKRLPLLLSDDQPFAERLGKRIDQDPVLLTVNTNQAIGKGADIKQYGRLFLLDTLPVGCFSGPPLPKERPLPKKSDDAKKEAKGPKTPGSYLLDLNQKHPMKKRDKRRAQKQKDDWKRERKRKNRDKGFP